MRYAKIHWGTQKVKKGVFSGKLRSEALMEAVSGQDKWSDLEFEFDEEPQNAKTQRTSSGTVITQQAQKSVYLKDNLPMLKSMTEVNVAPVLRDLMPGCYLYYSRDKGGMSGYLIQL